MTGSSWSPFINPQEHDLALPQLGFLTVVYGYVLFQASNLISDGSELLLFIPAMQGIIGSVILPVFGAVPDSMMVLFSGLGDRHALPKEVAVGVGTLAGSTIMLLTLPWCLAIFSGRVTIHKDGTLNYKRPRGAAGADWHKLMPTGSYSLTRTGVQGGKEIKTNALLMLATMTTYFVIQVPAFLDDKPAVSYDEQGAEENWWALVAFVLSGAWFIVYLARQYYESRRESEDPNSVNNEIEITNMIQQINDGKFTLYDAIKQFQQDAENETGRRMSNTVHLGQPGVEHGPEEPLIHDKKIQPIPKQTLIRMKLLLKSFFHKYNRNEANEIGNREFYFICQDMGLKVSREMQDRLFQDADIDKSGSISLKEFTSCIIDFARHHAGAHEDSDDEETQPRLPTHRSISMVHAMVHAISEDSHFGASSQASVEGKAAKDEDEESSEEDSEEDSVPEDLQDLDPRVQQLWILFRSFKLMFAGTLLVLLFSDPMVDVLAEIGTKLDVSPFYISFIIAPIASNASELVAAYNYARKRTERTITVSISTLQGAACMNNTLCLCVFLGLIYFRQLAWQFSAECLAIIVVEVILAVFSYCKRTQTLLDAILIATLYPLSLLLVWCLKDPELANLD